MTSSPEAASPTQTVDTTGIGRQMAKGTGWTVMTRLIVQGIGFVSTLILARLLVPADFGLVALATTFSAALMVISEFSFDVVLIQNQNADRGHYDTVWTLSLIRNLILALCLAAGARWTAAVLGDARLEGIIYWLAAATAANGLQNVGIVNFRKDLAFHRDLAFNVAQKLASFAITVPLAFLWRDYWALVAGIVGGNLAQVVLSFLLHHYRPRLSLAHWREIMHFSKWLVLNNVCAFIFSRCDTFVIGKLIGAQAVGIYGIGYEIANLTTANLVAPLRRAIFPAYAKVANDPSGLAKGFLDVLAVVVLIGTPMATGIGLVAEPLVHVMLGSQWIGSIPVIEILSLYGFLSVISSGSGPIFLATARPHYLLWILGGSSLVMVPLMIVGTHVAGVTGTAWAVTTGAALAALTDFILIMRLLELRLWRLVDIVWRPLVATGTMVVIVILAQAEPATPVNALGWSLVLVSSILAGALTYAVALLTLWWITGMPAGAERHVLDSTRTILQRMRRTRPA